MKNKSPKMLEFGECQICGTKCAWMPLAGDWDIYQLDICEKRECLDELAKRQKQKQIDTCAKLK